MCIAQFGQSADRGLHQVVGVRRTFALRQDVLDTHALEAGTHGPAGDHTGNGSCRTDNDLTAVVTERLIVATSTVAARDLHAYLLALSPALGHGSGYLAGLAQTETYDAVLVTYHNDCRKAECTTTFRYLGNALYAYESVFQLEVARSYFLYVGI